MACADCGCIFRECVESNSPTGCPHCSLSECCCWALIHKELYQISYSDEREKRLLRLNSKIGHELDEDFKRAGMRIREVLARDFEREITLAEVSAGRYDLTDAAYHRAMSHAIHNTLRDLEMMIG